MCKRFPQWRPPHALPDNNAAPLHPCFPCADTNKKPDKTAV
ncbi:hypothetical protein D8I24_1877 [Cupriavidus necator H850]|nr:hypothetical protein D8I24_1877 [Cupriavidus necator H850]